MVATEKSRIEKIRRIAKKHDFTLSKSRARKWSENNQQGYKLIYVPNNVTTDGQKYDLTIDAVEQILSAIDTADKMIQTPQHKKSNYITKSTILKRGWSLNAIKELLPAPLECKNPHYKYGAQMTTQWIAGWSTTFDIISPNMMTTVVCYSGKSGKTRGI